MRDTIVDVLRALFIELARSLGNLVGAYVWGAISRRLKLSSIWVGGGDKEYGEGDDAEFIRDAAGDFYLKGSCGVCGWSHEGEDVVAACAQHSGEHNHPVELLATQGFMFGTSAECEVERARRDTDTPDTHKTL